MSGRALAEAVFLTGTTNLNGDALVIGIKTNSLGVVTSSFRPVVSASVSGSFNRIFDAGVFKLVGTTPKIPDAVIDDLISFAQNSEEFAEEVASNKSEAEQVMKELLENEEGEQDSLICN